MRYLEKFLANNRGLLGVNHCYLVWFVSELLCTYYYLYTLGLKPNPGGPPIMDIYIVSIFVLKVQLVT